MLHLLAFLAAAAAPALDGNIDPELSSVTVQPATGVYADGVDSSTIRIQVLDQQGDPIEQIDVSVTAFGGGTILTQAPETDENGVTTAILRATAPGVKLISVTVAPNDESVMLADHPTVEFVPGPAPPTNVLLILMDDVGTDFLSFYDELNPYQADLPYVHNEVGEGDDPELAHLFVQAPNLLALAQEGVLFENVYANPLCSPTRASLYTGCYPVRTGVGDILLAENAGVLREFGDPGFERPTLPQLVQSADYADVLIGKWHLGLPRADMDSDTGDDQNLGWASIPERGHWSSWRAVFNNVDTPPVPGKEGTYYDFFFNRDHTTHAEVLADPESHATEFATTVEFGEALAWCNGQTGPFLCVVSANAAHAPWSLPVPAELVSTEEYINGPPNAFNRYCAQLEALDRKIGELVNGLAPAIRSATLILVMGDNGTPAVVLEHARLVGEDGSTQGSGIDVGATYDFLLDEQPRRFKGTTYEKGTRVPLIAVGQGVVGSGRTSRALVDITDIFPTIAEVTGQPAGDVQGISFAPVLRDEVDYHTHARDFSYSELFSPLGLPEPHGLHTQRRIGCSLRIPGEGRYKIVRDQDYPEDEFYRLQDASGAFVDPFETEPLAHGPGDPDFARYQLVLAKLEAIIASGADVGPGLCQDPTSFCTSAPNSTGEPALMSWAGSCSVAIDEFVLVAEPVPPHAGIFFYGAGQLNGGDGMPFGNGTLCIGGATYQRLSVELPVDGRLLHAVDFAHPPNPSGAILPGSTWHFQAWYRDPQAGGSQFNLSDGLTVGFLP